MLILGNTVYWTEKEFHNLIDSIEKEIREWSYQFFKMVRTVGIMDETELNYTIFELDVDKNNNIKNGDHSKIL